jgi:UDP-perosamine 4-acetyltransferase
MIGGGGHAKVVIEILQSMSVYEIVGYVDRKSGTPVLGCCFLGTDELLPHLLREGITDAFVALGDNAMRLELAESVAAQGFEMPSAVSPAAAISPSARIGRGVAIMSGVAINACAAIEDYAIINTRASIDHDSIVGKAAHVAPGAAICGNVSIGELALIGAGVSIIPDITVGARAKVGAGAAVLCDVPADAIAVGVPARIALSRPRLGNM